MITPPNELPFYLITLIALIGGIVILRIYKPHIDSQSSLFRIFGIILIIFGIIGLCLGFLRLIVGGVHW